jgi:hypothetical protein
MIGFRRVAVAAWVLTALLFVGQAAAQPMRPHAERGGPQRMMPESRAVQGAAEDGMQGRQRMSAEERRQLRRDVHDAGRDLYRDEMREKMRERRREMRRGE